MLSTLGMKEANNDNEPTWQSLSAATARVLRKELENGPDDDRENERADAAEKSEAHRCALLDVGLLNKRLPVLTGRVWPVTAQGVSAAGKRF